MIPLSETLNSLNFSFALRTQPCTLYRFLSNTDTSLQIFWASGHSKNVTGPPCFGHNLYTSHYQLFSIDRTTS